MAQTYFEQHILPLFEVSREAWLAEARAVARGLGVGGVLVTIDEVRAILPPPAGIDPRVMGAVFKRSEWVLDHYVSSKRVTCHKRPIGAFRLKA